MASVSVQLQTEGRQVKIPPFLPLITFTPIPNFMDQLSMRQRQVFLEYIKNFLHQQLEEEKARSRAAVAAVNSSRQMPVLSQVPSIRAAFPKGDKQPLSAVLPQKSGQAAKDGEAAPAVAVARLSCLKYEKSEEKGEGGGETPPAGGAPPKGMKEPALLRKETAPASPASSFSQPSPVVHPGISVSLPIALELSPGSQIAEKAVQAHSELSRELLWHADGDQKRADGALEEFESRLSSLGYKVDDLMATLLLVIEDKQWGEGGAGVGWTMGGQSRGVLSSIPKKLLNTAASEQVETRLASVREMLRYYFIRNPQDFRYALAAALSIPAGKSDDGEFLQDRLAYELARVGNFALAEKILAEIKRRKKMDTKKCLMELGYRYDVKKKRLILGKRTCGTPVEAKGIIALLLGGLKK